MYGRDTRQDPSGGTIAALAAILILSTGALLWWSSRGHWKTEPAVVDARSWSRTVDEQHLLYINKVTCERAVPRVLVNEGRPVDIKGRAPGACRHSHMRSKTISDGYDSKTHRFKTKTVSETYYTYDDRVTWGQWEWTLTEVHKSAGAEPEKIHWPPGTEAPDKEEVRFRNFTSAYRIRFVNLEPEASKRVYRDAGGLNSLSLAVPSWEQFVDAVPGTKWDLDLSWSGNILAYRPLKLEVSTP